jgi:hypothetical protein
MENVATVDVLEDFVEVSAPPEVADRPKPRRLLRRVVGGTVRGISSAAEWVFGVISLILGLSILAALPIAQFLTMGYFLESSARVARSGRLRDGVFGVRKAARVGGLIAGIWLALIPLWLAGVYTRSAELIDPGGPIARVWKFVQVFVTGLTLIHIAVASARGGRLRFYLWPFGNPFWLARRLRRGGFYQEARDGLWEFVASLRLPYFFRVGAIGFFGTLAWLIVPATFIAVGTRAPIMWPIGVIVLGLVVPFLPFLQVRYAVEGRASALFSLGAIRERFRRAPWAFAFALLALLIAAIPLYLLKIEMVPREAAWLPSLVFVIFLAPARLLTGWAYARSVRRYRPRHWLFRIMGRLAIVPAALFYVIVVFFAQYTSWGGVASVYEQHAFLLPVPFLNM